jgi:hypothetical protein
MSSAVLGGYLFKRWIFAKTRLVMLLLMRAAPGRMSLSFTPGTMTLDTAEYSNTGVKFEGLCDDAFDMRDIKRMRKEPKRSGLEVEPLRAPINQREVVFHDDYVYSTVGVMSFAPQRS